MRPLTLAHISDLHVLDLAGVRPQQFVNKRLTGAANLLGSRRNAHPLHVAEVLADRMAQPDIDHVAISGDVTNLALPSEFARAAQVIAKIGGPQRVTMIPGNHDVYTWESLRARRFEQHFGAYLGDTEPSRSEARNQGRAYYPFARALAPHVRLYGLSSAVPTPAFFALGRVGAAQLQRLRQMVAAEPAEVRVRIAMVHHNLHRRGPVAEATARLLDRADLAEALLDCGVALLLHGHTHHPHQGHLLGKGGAVLPVIGCGSSTWHRADQPNARCNLIDIGADGIAAVRSLHYSAQDDAFAPEHADLLARALQDDRRIVT